MSAKACKVRGCKQAAWRFGDGMCHAHWSALNRARGRGRGNEVALENAAEREAIQAEGKLPAGEGLGALGRTYGGGA